MASRLSWAARMSVATYIALLPCLVGCLGPADQVDAKNIPVAAAIRQLDDQFSRIRIPDTFAPYKATSQHAAWGSGSQTVAVMFSAHARDIDAFLVRLHASKGSTYPGAQCSDGSARSDTDGNPPEQLARWYEVSSFDKCLPVDFWKIPENELKNGKSIGGIYRQAAAGKARDQRLIVWVVTA